MASSLITIIAIWGAVVSDIQILFPENSVSSRPVIEFRARKPGDTADGGKSPVGHSFVALGRELDNGLTVYYGIAGFYPEPGTNKVQTAKYVLYGPGETQYKLNDIQSDTRFRAYLTESQEREIKFIIKNWDNNKYSLPFQNCNDLVKNIANNLGLSYSNLAQTPMGIIESLAEANSSRDTVREAERRELEAQRKHATEIERIEEIKRQREERQREEEERKASERFKDQVTPGGGGSAEGSGQNGGGGIGGTITPGTKPQ